MSNDKKNILITGGAGFIGSHLAEKLLQKGDEVFVIDDLSTGSLENIRHLKDKYQGSFHFLCKKMKYEPNEPDLLPELGLDNFNDDFLKNNNPKGLKSISVIEEYRVQDSREKEFGFMHSLVGKTIKDKKIDEIYHLAATVGVKLILEKPLTSIRNNIIGTDIVLDQAAKIWDKGRGRIIKVLIASSSEVCGKNEPPFKEDDDRTYGSVYNHRWSYAFSKGADEFLGLAQYRENRLPVIIVRFFNVIGPKQTGFYGMVVPSLVQQALNKNDITVYGDGEQTRCFADVEDVTDALINLMLEEKAVGRVINLGSDREISINKLAEEIRKQTHSNSEIVHIPYEKAYGEGFEDFRRRVPDLSAIKSLINYSPRFTLEETLGKIIDYFRSH